MQFALPVFLLLPDDDCHGPSKAFYESAAEDLKNTSIKAYFSCAALKSAEAHPAMGVTCPNLDEREALPRYHHQNKVHQKGGEAVFVLPPSFLLSFCKRDAYATF